ncbi:MAG: hypothetical protein RMA76_37900 [Deltaproteobacteria bacterium]|jgi:hypothetical protein
MKRLLLCLPLAGCFIGAEDVPPDFERPGPQGRYGASVAFDAARARLITYGGENDVGIQTTTWSFAQGRWSRLTSAGPPAREGAAMVYDVERDRVVLFGGELVDPSEPCDATWELVGEAWTRVDVPAPTCRRGHVMTYDAEARRVLLFGGFAAEGCAGGACQQTWAYDGTWTLVNAP